MARPPFERPCLFGKAPPSKHEGLCGTAARPSIKILEFSSLFLWKNFMLKIQNHYAEFAGVSFFRKLRPIHRKYLLNSFFHWICCPNVKSITCGEKYCFYAQEINNNLPGGFIFY